MQNKNHLASKISAIIVMFYLMSLVSCQQQTCNSYLGTPYSDSKYNAGAQIIPGKLQCEYYDIGGDGVAYHDSDTINSGSGNLNKIDGSYLHGFRASEGVDISYTKFDSSNTDNNPFNLVEPQPNQLYVGWTNPGEWTKYTVDVKQTGTYKLGIMYTAFQNGQIALSVNDIDTTSAIDIASTYSELDTLDWRQWHHWNYADDIATLSLKKGLQTITLHTVAAGGMNYDFINFELISN